MADESKTPKYTVEQELFFLAGRGIKKDIVESIVVEYKKHGKADILYKFGSSALYEVREEFVAESPEELCSMLLDEYKESSKPPF